MKLSPSLRDFALAKSWQSTSSKNAKAQKVDSRIFTQATQPAHHDSKNCGGAVGALRFLGKVSELGVRAFHKNRNTAALPTQS
ncbi:hypothetical protein [uncultured Helicobacter sp.]|uniref:hypothetical protein n=1 Tax=uncultured Helicobacter sp. TaxID=175537 RepID=UPI00260E48FA|nr:hypothetical protein [uncultured Helicobacter sp.]